MTHILPHKTDGNSPTVGFVFLIETAQTALTGADVYYWFMAGFGDTSITLDYWFLPIDLPIITGIVSLTVQIFFCYGIYALNKRLRWLCVVISVVSLIPPLFVSTYSTYLCKAICCSGKWGHMVRNLPLGMHKTTLIAI